MTKYLIFLLFMSQFSCKNEVIVQAESIREGFNYPIIAHAHNDYERDEPIFKARQFGFKSLEVDIIYDGQDIRVSHDDEALETKPLFEDSYLNPLIEDTSLSEDQIFLIVDIKIYNQDLMNQLYDIFLIYENNLVSRESLSDTLGKVKIILSGDIPREELMNDSMNKFIFLDGRLNALGLSADRDLMPLISMDFTELSNWQGQTQPSDKIIQEVSNAINQVHQSGKMLRFWKTKDKELVWMTLLGLDIDMIGVDDIGRFYHTMDKNGLIN